MSRPEDSIIDPYSFKFLFPPGATIDPIEIVKIFDHASEKHLFLSSLQERIHSAERRAFILDIIDRVRKFSSSSSENVEAMTVSSVPENLHQNFITVALPEILRSIPPANLRRQGIQHFGMMHSLSKNNDDDILIKSSIALGSNNNKNDKNGTTTSDKSPKTTSSHIHLHPCLGVSSPSIDMISSGTVNSSSSSSSHPVVCVAKRIFITGKNGATNLPLIKYLGITHFVKACEMMPKHNSVDFIKDVVIGGILSATAAADKQKLSPPSTSCTANLDEILLDVGMKDDDQSDNFAKNFDRVVNFVKAKLRENGKRNNNKILIFCQAGKHRSAWYSAAVLAALSRDREFCCPCLSERTRYHSSLVYSVCHSIVKQCRSFVDFSPAAEEQISKWIAEKKLKTVVSSSSSDDEEEK